MGSSLKLEDDMLPNLATLLVSWGKRLISGSDLQVSVCLKAANIFVS